MSVKYWVLLCFFTLSSNFIAADDVCLDSLPESFQLQGLMIDQNGEQTITCQFHQDAHGIEYIYYSDDSVIKIQADRNLRMELFQVNNISEETIQEEKMRTLKIERREGNLYDIREENHRGKVNHSEFEMDDTIDMSLLSLYLQAQLSSEALASEFQLELFTFYAGRSFDVEIIKHSGFTEDIMSEYQYPPQMIEIIHQLQSEEYSLVSGKLKGMAGVFYPYPFYYVYDSAHQPLLEWGGSSDDPYYYIFKVMQVEEENL